MAVNDVPSDPAVAPAPAPRSWYSSRWGLAALALTSLLIVSGIVFARPLFNAWKKSGARALAIEAQSHSDAGRWDQASRLMGEAFMKDPTEPVVLRTLARFMRKVGAPPERTLYFWQQLVNSGNATLEDRTAMGEAHISASQPSEARKILEELLPVERNTRFALELESSLLRTEGRSGEADVLLRRALLMDPDNPECILKLASMDLSDPFIEVQERAVNMLWSLARGKTPESVNAIQLLAGDRRLTVSQADELLSLVAANELGNAKLRYTVLTASMRLLPLNKDAMIDKEAKAHQDTPLAEKVEYLRWLFTMNEHDRILQSVPADKATRMPELFPIYVEALAGKKRWTELQGIMRNSPSLPMSAIELSLLKARCAQGLGEPAKVIRSHLDEACRRSVLVRDMPNLLRSAGIAEGLGFDDIALETYRKAVSLPQYQVVMLEKILLVQTKQKDADGMLATLRDIVAAKPGLRSHQENTFYLRLLIGKDIEVAPLQADAMARDGKITPAAHHLLEALAAYRVANLDNMKASLAEIDVETLTVGQRAVFAGMLSVTGETAKAFAIAEKLRRSLLLHEEEKFLNLAL